MLRQALNEVVIEGILSEMDIKKGSYVKQGETVETISGTIKVRVDQVINTNPVTCEIPVSFFSQKYNKEGKENGIYKAIETMSNELTSIAAAGNENDADRVRISGSARFANGTIQMNEYYNPNGRLVSFPRIHASFVNKVRKEEFKPTATFTLEFAIASMDYETNANGEQTDKYLIKAIVPQYGGRVDVIDLYAVNPNVIDVISSSWQPQDTVKAKGRLNFSSKTETFIEDLGFGEPEEKSRTINVSELIITGGAPTPLEGDFAFDINEIQQALTERKARLDELKEKATGGSKVRKAPAMTSSAGGLDLGF